MSTVDGRLDTQLTYTYPGEIKVSAAGGGLFVLPAVLVTIPRDF